MNASEIIKRLLVSVIVVFTLIACDQPATSTTGTANDTSSVKKMSTDSNSEMPVHIPTDSTEKIPNPYDTTRK